MCDDYQDWDNCDCCQQAYAVDALIYKPTDEKLCIQCETQNERLWAIRLSEAKHVAS